MEVAAIRKIDAIRSVFRPIKCIVVEIFQCGTLFFYKQVFS